jgi:hypothetical protein
VDDVHKLVAQVAAALREVGITPEGPVVVPPAHLPANLAGRVPLALRSLWEHGATRLRWRDHDEQRLGRDARHGGIWFLTPGAAEQEVREYRDLIEDERNHAEPQHLELAEATWGRWTPFHRFASGDCLALDRAGEVVIWQHDLLDGGPYFHGLRLGTTLEAFLATWARVGFAEPRDWRTVATADNVGLDLDAADWRLLL